MPNRTKKTPARVEKFLSVLRQRANVTEAAATIGVGRTAVYAWRDADPSFAEAWDNAVDEAVDVLEAEAWRRAVHGMDRPITWKGEVIGTVKEYSDRLLECLLRAHRPEKFLRRVQTQFSPGTDLGRMLEEARDRRKSGQEFSR